MALYLFVLFLVISVSAAVIYEQQRQIGLLKEGANRDSEGYTGHSALLGQQLKALSGWTAGGQLTVVGGPKPRGQLLLVFKDADAIDLKQVNYAVVLARREGLKTTILGAEGAATTLLADDVIAPLVVLMARVDMPASLSAQEGALALFLAACGEILAVSATTQKTHLETAAAEARLKQVNAGTPGSQIKPVGGIL
jgi:hypothetical protein